MDYCMCATGRRFSRLVGIRRMRLFWLLVVLVGGSWCGILAGIPSYVHFVTFTSPFKWFTMVCSEITPKRVRHFGTLMPLYNQNILGLIYELSSQRVSFFRLHCLVINIYGLAWAFFLRWLCNTLFNFFVKLLFLGKRARCLKWSLKVDILMIVGSLQILEL